MIPVLVSIVVLLAVSAWVVAAVSLVRAIALVPKGQRLSALFSSGFWQFEKIRALGGPEVDIHLRRYMYGFGAFFLAIVLGMALGIISAATSSRDAPAVAQAVQLPAVSSAARMS